MPSNPRITHKDLGLIKGALRRVFARSELHRQIVEESRIEYSDPERPRVKKWSRCAACKQTVATYQTEVDHIVPLIPLDKHLEDLTWDELFDRLWCDKSNLQIICLTCHKEKCRLEREERKKLHGPQKRNKRSKKTTP